MLNCIVITTQEYTSPSATTQSTTPPSAAHSLPAFEAPVDSQSVRRGTQGTTGAERSMDSQVPALAPTGVAVHTTDKTGTAPKVEQTLQQVPVVELQVDETVEAGPAEEGGTSLAKVDVVLHIHLDEPVPEVEMQLAEVYTSTKFVVEECAAEVEVRSEQTSDALAEHAIVAPRMGP